MKYLLIIFSLLLTSVSWSKDVVYYCEMTNNIQIDADILSWKLATNHKLTVFPNEKFKFQLTDEYINFNNPTNILFEKGFLFREKIIGCEFAGHNGTQKICFGNGNYSYTDHRSRKLITAKCSKFEN